MALLHVLSELFSLSFFQLSPHGGLQDQEEDDEEAEGEEGVCEGEGGGVLQRDKVGEEDGGEEDLLLPPQDCLPPLQDEGV